MIWMIQGSVHCLVGDCYLPQNAWIGSRPQRACSVGTVGCILVSRSDNWPSNAEVKNEQICTFSPCVCRHGVDMDSLPIMCLVPHA